MEKETVKRGNYIYKEGDGLGYIYFINRGEIEVSNKIFDLTNSGHQEYPLQTHRRQDPAG